MSSAASRQEQEQQESSPSVANACQDPEHPRNLIPELCRLFYSLGWVTGTGGGISIRHSPDEGTAAPAPSDGGASSSNESKQENNSDSSVSKESEYYIAPSGVQKERIQPEDMFILSAQGDVLGAPANPKLRMSQCTPLFFNAFALYNSGAVIHTHSQHAVLMTQLWGGKHDKVTFTHQEMIKGIRVQSHPTAHFSYYDELSIPIIENTAHERDLTVRMLRAMIRFPDAPAVLVRNHGLYVWGETWQKAKTQCECLDYLFELTLRQLSFDASLGIRRGDQTPPDSEYANFPDRRTTNIREDAEVESLLTEMLEKHPILLRTDLLLGGHSKTLLSQSAQS